MLANKKMGDVVKLNVKPKEIVVTRKDRKGKIVFLPAKRLWSWKVEIYLDPHVFEGEAATLEAATKEMEQYLKP
jgi:hypothetical protein